MTTIPIELLTPTTLDQVFGVLALKELLKPIPAFFPICICPDPDAYVLADFVQEHIDIQELNWAVPLHPDSDTMQPVKMWCLWWCLKHHVQHTQTNMAQAALTYLIDPSDKNRREAHRVGNTIQNNTTVPNIAFLASFHPTPACLIAYPNIVEPLRTNGYTGYPRELPHIRLLYHLLPYLPTTYTLA